MININQKFNDTTLEFLDGVDDTALDDLNRLDNLDDETDALTRFTDEGEW